MTRPTTQEAMLAGLESNISTTARQIQQLKMEFAALVLSGQTLERRSILQQLAVLEDNLELLKVRRTYALELAD
jgi:hypothetical protein